MVQRDGPRLIVEMNPSALSRPDLAADQRFFRANPQSWFRSTPVASFRSAGKGRLLLTVRIPADDDVLVSQAAAASLRAWIERLSLRGSGPAGPGPEPPS